MNHTVKLVSIEGRWGLPIYPQKKQVTVADLLPEKVRLRPQAQQLMKALRHNREKTTYVYA